MKKDLTKRISQLDGKLSGTRKNFYTPFSDEEIYQLVRDKVVNFPEYQKLSEDELEEKIDQLFLAVRELIRDPQKRREFMKSCENQKSQDGQPPSVNGVENA